MAAAACLVLLAFGCRLPEDVFAKLAKSDAKAAARQVARLRHLGTTSYAACEKEQGASWTDAAKASLRVAGRRLLQGDEAAVLKPCTAALRQLLQQQRLIDSARVSSLRLAFDKQLLKSSAGHLSILATSMGKQKDDSSSGGQIGWVPRLAAALFLERLGADLSIAKVLLGGPDPAPASATRLLAQLLGLHTTDVETGAAIVSTIEESYFQEGLAENATGGLLRDVVRRKDMPRGKRQQLATGDDASAVSLSSAPQNVQNSVLVKAGNWLIERATTGRGGGWQVRLLERASRFFDAVFEKASASGAASGSSSSVWHQYNYSAALLKCRRYDRAAEVLRDVLARTGTGHPGFPRGLVNLIAILQRKGGEGLQEAERLAAQHWAALTNAEEVESDVRLDFLTTGLRLEGEAVLRKAATTLRAWLGQGRLLASLQQSGWFALAKAYRRLGEAEDMVSAAKQGCRLVLAEPQAAALQRDTLVQLLAVSQWRSRHLAQTLGGVQTGEAVKLVMIVGPPRSGTSLLENILLAASEAASRRFDAEVLPLGEVPVLHEAAQRAEAALGKDFIVELLKNPSALEQHRAALLTGLSDAVEKSEAVSWLSARPGKEDAQSASVSITSSQRPRIVICKWPLDLMHVTLAAVLLRGHLRVIHCRRDARDNAASVYIRGCRLRLRRYPVRPGRLHWFTTAPRR
eukprot:TRINITY_DN15415_c0_g1_i6.p1 TRINITY_DN15415_c0_g1~~TRINITY_DN15415_c0_g1_i6.p1  ORF type:complete len:689 (-),score=150.73 TRINITY_DN15415_c0_g1_i6:130-2196(-)